ncbi:MAG: methyltransferase [Rhodoferax sp.]|nr:methyltransferase [Rhodoferax sp.]
MDFSTPHPLQRYWDLAAAPIQAEALAVALSLGLFEALDHPKTAAELATLLQLHPDNTRYLLELLWSMELCQRIPGDPADQYQTHAQAQRFFTRGSADCCADAWLFRLRALRHAATQLGELVQHGTQSAPPFANGSTSGWAQAARVQIGQEQQAVTVPAALAVLAQVPGLGQARRMLDLGGGPGWVAIALAQRYPELRGVVFDGPPTAEVAAENIHSAGLNARLQAQGGDLVHDPIGGDYDLVWCSSVLHFVPDIPTVLAKMLAALRPGGVLVCAHAEVGDTPAAAARVLPYYLPMRMQGRHVTPQGQLATQLGQAGFANIRSFESQAFPMAPVQVLVARKEPA